MLRDCEQSLLPKGNQMTNKALEDMSVDEIIQELYSQIDMVETRVKEITFNDWFLMKMYMAQLEVLLESRKMSYYTRLKLEGMQERLMKIGLQVEQRLGLDV